jgi:hypothetical protein
MSYMADRDHIAITSRDTSTTRRKVLVPGCPVVLPNTVTHRESSDTYSRIAPVSEIVAGKYPPGPAGYSASLLSTSRRRGRAGGAAYPARLERSGSRNPATGRQM